MSLLEEKLANLPDEPGVYIMKDASDRIIYIGKAVSLRNRVRQYFQSSRGHSEKVKSMVSRIRDFEYIITDSELEALILECNLIKKHKPHYNILLKDDKHYPYIKITTEEEYPRVVITRRVEKDKNRYFGPYTSTRAVRETLDILKKVFPIRTCKKNVKQGTVIDRPCLNYHIKQCMGPCQGNIDKNEYHNIIINICSFLDGKYDEILSSLKEEMAEAAENLQFERAAALRDKIAAVDIVLQNQKVLSTAMEDQDVIAFAHGKEETMVQMFFIRSGKLIGTEQFCLEETLGTEHKEVISSFIKQFYLISPFIPKEILLQEEIDEILIIERWLSERRGNRVYIRVPKRGEKHKLVQMAIKNAEEALANLTLKVRREKERTQGASEDLAKYLDLEKPPFRIEAFDISNFQGAEAVASMVVFEGGKPKNKDYRRFKIKTVDGPNDFASMAEVVRRRYSRGLKEREELNKQGKDYSSGKFSSFPDLILIDGGKGQLSSALNALRGLGISDIPVIGLAEEFEEIYMEDREEPVRIPRDANALHLLQRVRDEAHRFAITYHRSLRDKNSLHSVLEDIPEIGPKRRRELFKYFGSVDAIRGASMDELCKVPGMNKRAAERIREYFQ